MYHRNGWRPRQRKRGRKKNRARRKGGVSRCYFVDRARHVRVLGPSCLWQKKGALAEGARKERRRKGSGRSEKWRQCAPNRQAVRRGRERNWCTRIQMRAEPRDSLTEYLQPLFKYHRVIIRLSLCGI